MNDACGCCEGIQPVTPKPVANRPGLPALAYRVGTHSSFLETMLARLSSSTLTRPTGAYDAQGRPTLETYNTLGGLNTRDPSDFSIALLDLWATVADVLTFYQERIANEGYIRTATERRSVVELSRLIGYTLKPGVSASVYLAYTLEKDTDTTIPAGARSQSVPAAGQRPQSFETSEDLEARVRWNDLEPRSTRPQKVPNPLKDGHRLFLQGIATKLHPGDPLLVRADPSNVYRVAQVKPDAAAGRTAVVVRSWYVAPELGLESVVTVQRVIDDFNGKVAAQTTGPVPSFVADRIQKNALGALQQQIKQGATVEAHEEAVYSAVRQLAAVLVGVSDATWVPHSIDLWDALAQTLLTKSRTHSIELSRKNHPIDAPPSANPPDAVRQVNKALQDLDITVESLTHPKTPSAQPDSPRAADLVARFVVALQTTIESLRLAAPAFAAKSTPRVAVDSLISEFTDLVRTLPAQAIWFGLDAIAKVYRDRADEIAGRLSTAGSPENPNLTIVLDTIDGPGGVSSVPPLVDPAALAGRVQDAYESNGLDRVDLSKEADPDVAALVRSLQTSLRELIDSLTFGPVRRDIRAIITRYTDPDQGIFAGTPDPVAQATGVADTAIAQRAIATLNEWIKSLSQDSTPAEVVASLQLQLTALRSELRLAQAGGYPRTEPWLSSLTADLEDVIQQRAPSDASPGGNGQARANGQVQAPVPGAGPSSNGTGAAPTPPIPLDKLLGQLLTPPAVLPPDSAQLPRSLTNAFALDTGAKGNVAFTSADVSAQLLATFDPRLKSSLYPALANVEVSRSSDPTTVRALRVKAAPFGATAPRKPVVSNGIVVGDEEWRLSSATILLELPSIPAGLSPGNTINVRITIDRDGIPDSAEMSFGLGTTTIPLRDTTVTVTTDPATSTGTAALNSLTFEFTNTGPARDPGAVYERIAVEVQAAARQFMVSLGGDPAIAVNAQNSPIRNALFGHEVELAFRPAALMGGLAGLSIKDVVPESLPSRFWNVLTLDGVFDQIVRDGWVVIERTDRADDKQLQVRRVVAVGTVAEAAFGLTAKATRLTLDANWLDQDDTDLSAYRQATVYAQSEALALAEEPYDADVAGQTIELDDLYGGLKSGRFVIVSGERTDIPATGGVRASELAMLSSVKQDFDPSLPGDKLHSYLGLSVPLAYTYKRASVTIYGNVVKATHGETRSEVLGSGSAGLAMQAFPLKQEPLTFVSSPNPRGAETTLEVRVNDVRWDEVDSLAALGPTDRAYVTLTDNDDNVSVVFGDGEHGARLPSGRENVAAKYRTGIGRDGNVGADQITLLITRPLGVKSVTDPLAASGGADRESLDQAKLNAPRSVTALDRLVSVRDFEDFARNFAGIGKASAQRFARGGSEFVHLTVAGADDIPIDPNSDLAKNLVRSLRLNGDPFLPVAVDRRERIVVILSADVRVTPGYLWEKVSGDIRTALLVAFGFGRRELGQCLWLSEVYRVIQDVDGVDYVSIKSFGSLSEKGTDGKIITFAEIRDKISKVVAQSPPPDRIVARLAQFQDGGIAAAQLALMTADVPDTIILREIQP